MTDTKYEKFLKSPPVHPKNTTNWGETSPDEKSALIKQHFKDKRAWRKKGGQPPKNKLSGLSDTQLATRLSKSGVRGKWKLEEEFKQRSVDNPTMYEQLEREEKKEANRDKSGAFVLKAKGGYVKKYAKGGGVRKVRS